MAAGIVRSLAQGAMVGIMATYLDMDAGNSGTGCRCNFRRCG